MALKTRIAQGFIKPLRNRVAEVDLMSVFELVQNLPHDSAAAVDSHCGFERQVPMSAIDGPQDEDRAGFH